jgi:hypothetical protein
MQPVQVESLEEPRMSLPLFLICICNYNETEWEITNLKPWSQNHCFRLWMKCQAVSLHQSHTVRRVWTRKGKELKISYFSWWITNSRKPCYKLQVVWLMEWIAEPALVAKSRFKIICITLRVGRNIATISSKMLMQC